MEATTILARGDVRPGPDTRQDLRRELVLLQQVAKPELRCGSGCLEVEGSPSGRVSGRDPVISQIVLAATAFGDSFTVRRAQVVNQQDHAQVGRLLRNMLGNLLPDRRERRYRRGPSFKDEVQYGTRQATRDEVGRLLADLDELARWAQELL